MAIQLRAGMRIKDNDPRVGDRFGTILRFENLTIPPKAEIEWTSGRRTWIKQSRIGKWGKKGYSIVEEPKAESLPQ